MSINIDPIGPIGPIDPTDPIDPIDPIDIEHRIRPGCHSGVAAGARHDSLQSSGDY